MILEKIAASTKVRVHNKKIKVPLDNIKEMALKMVKDENSFTFENKLRENQMSFICEVKKASPSKGIISKDFDYKKIAIDYENAGASCISVLTEPEYFLGSDEYLKEIKEVVHLPIIRKDFTIDEYQIYEAKVVGADAVLLICSLLTKEEITRFIKICDSLGLSHLVEAHDEDEVALALNCNARVIGVNNRNLKDFTVNIKNSITLRKKIPENILFVAESGIKTREDMIALEESKVNAVLIGETLMRSENKKAMLNYLKRGDAFE